MTVVDLEKLHIANNLPARVQSIYKDLHAAFGQARRNAIYDPAMTELEFRTRTDGTTLEIVPSGNHRHAATLLLRSSTTGLGRGLGKLDVQIKIDKNAVCLLLKAMRLKPNDAYITLKYYNTILVLPNVLTVQSGTVRTTAELCFPFQPYETIAVFEFDSDEMRSLRNALLQIESDQGMSPYEHWKAILEERDDDNEGPGC